MSQLLRIVAMGLLLVSGCNPPGTGGGAGSRTVEDGTGGSGTGGLGVGGSGMGGMPGTGAGIGSTVSIDCNSTMPSGGNKHIGNLNGGTGNLTWQL
jgi:hypothetical protein